MISSTRQLTREETRRVERVAWIAAISAAGIAPLVAVPVVFAVGSRILGAVGNADAALSFAWSLALALIAGASAALWTARRVPAMVRGGIAAHASVEDPR
jgi:hypothetical protein